MASFFFSWFEEERRLDVDEKPLVVQLNWNKDDREGRFVLKNENDAIPAKVQHPLDSFWAGQTEVRELLSLFPERGLLTLLPEISVTEPGSSLPHPLFH